MWLLGLVILRELLDLRQLSAAALRRLFAFASSGKINATRVIKNLIWQAYTATCRGTAPAAKRARAVRASPD